MTSDQTGTDGNERASLVLNIESDLQLQTLLPDVDTTASDYEIEGSGPDGSGFEVVTGETTVEFTALEPGDWTVTANAKNKDGVVLSMGMESTTLQPGNKKSVNLRVTPVQGYGTLDLSIFWTPGGVGVPSVEAQLVPVSGSSVDLSFSRVQDSATCVHELIPTGNHTLILKLCDNGNMVAGAVEVVKIMNKQTTSGVFEFYDDGQTEPCLSVNITPKVNDAIPIAIDGKLSEIPPQGSMTLTASSPDGTGNVVYVWYLNGEAKETGAVYTVGSDLAPGMYRIDVTAFSPDGKKAGTATHTFAVTDSREVTLTWDHNSETDLAGYRIHYGTSSGMYTCVVDAGNRLTCTVSGLSPGETYYFTATAYNTSQLESDFSNEVAYTVPF